MQEQSDHSCGIVPILKSGTNVTYLLIRHTLGHWDFPKGHPEKGEPDLQAAERELFEETGLVCEHILPDPIFEVRYSFVGGVNPDVRIDKTVTFFLGKIKEPVTLQLQAIEVQDAAWLSYEDALAILTFNTTKDLLTRVESYLNAHS